MKVNVGEYGTDIRIDLSEDVSGETVQIVLKDPSGNEVTKTATVGTTAETDQFIGQIVANEWIYYTLADGDLDEDGRWKVRGIANDGSALRKTNWLVLVVKP